MIGLDLNSCNCKYQKIEALACSNKRLVRCEIECVNDAYSLIFFLFLSFAAASGRTSPTIVKVLMYLCEELSCTYFRIAFMHLTTKFSESAVQRDNSWLRPSFVDWFYVIPHILCKRTQLLVACFFYFSSLLKSLSLPSYLVVKFHDLVWFSFFFFRFYVSRIFFPSR